LTRPKLSPRKQPTQEVAKPIPLVSVRVDGNYRLTVNHESTKEPSFEIEQYLPALIQITPQDKTDHSISIRLIPPNQPKGRWKMSIYSQPWMNIRNGKLSMGQTPRSNLRLPFGPSQWTFFQQDLATSVSIDVRRFD
jgi:hypothetical protein